METVWTVQDAKNRFSEMVEHALYDGPQTITRRGRETAVMVSIEAFRELAGANGDLVHFFQKSPLTDAGLDIDRRPDYGRGVEL